MRHFPPYSNPADMPEFEISHPEINAELIRMADESGRLNPSIKLCSYAVYDEAAVNPMVS